MALKTAAVSVETTATRLDVYPDEHQNSQPFGFSLIVCNEGTDDIRIGGPDVAFTGETRGLLVAAGHERSIDIRDARGGVYGISESTTVSVTIGQEGV